MTKEGVSVADSDSLSEVVLVRVDDFDKLMGVMVAVSVMFSESEGDSSDSEIDWDLESDRV